MAKSGPDPSPHETRRQLEIMLASEVFTLRPQQARLFEFLVRGALADDELTEKHIREELYPSPPYGPESNIVRRTDDLVRDLLREYYSGPGQDDLVIIELPHSPHGRRLKLQAGEAYKPDFSYNPQHRVTELYNLGRHYLAKGTPYTIVDALKRFEQVLELAPEHTGAKLGLAEGYFPLVLCDMGPPGITKHLNVWEDHVRTYISGNPPYWRAHSVLATILMLSWRLKEAGKEFAVAKKLNAAEALNYSWLPIYHLSIGNQDEALWAANGIIRSNVNDPIPRCIMGLLQYVLRNFEDAKQALEQALQLDHTFWLAHLIMSLVCFALGDPKQALDHYVRTQWFSDHLYSLFPGLFQLYSRHGTTPFPKEIQLLRGPNSLNYHPGWQ
jgi:tetratricopeptide (TPR) repeat protein